MNKDNINNYNNFLFFGKWRILLDVLDEQLAKEMCWQIMKYGTNRDIDTDNPLIEGIINGTIAENINHSQTRYNKALKGGRPKIDIDIDIVMDYVSQGKTYEEIANIMGVSVNTIGNRIREYRNNLKNENK